MRNVHPISGSNINDINYRICIFCVWALLRSSLRWNPTPNGYSSAVFASSSCRMRLSVEHLNLVQLTSTNLRSNKGAVELCESHLHGAWYMPPCSCTGHRYKQHLTEQPFPSNFNVIYVLITTYQLQIFFDLPWSDCCEMLSDVQYKHI